MTTIVTTTTDYPCASLLASPPPVDDVLSGIDADGALPLTLALTPRGPAWGTDEAGDGSGASPVLRGWWRALAGVMADGLRAAFQTALQSAPSAITWSLGDWERDLGLPESCTPGERPVPQRIAAVRLKHAAFGAASPGYFICLAASLGYSITIEEPDSFTVDESECDGLDAVAEIPVDQFWIVNVSGLQETWFYADEGECADTPLEGYAAYQELECELRRQSPMHAILIFNYS